MTVPDGARYSELELWRRGPSKPTGRSLERGLNRVAEVSGTGIGRLDLEAHVPRCRVTDLARHGMAARAQALRRLGHERRLATLVATVAYLEGQAIDDCLELLDLLMTTDLLSRAEKAAGDRAEAPAPDQGRLHLPKLSAIPDPPSLADLRKRVAAMLPRVDLPEVILEVMGWVPEFAAAFTPASGGRSRLDDLHVSVAACLTAQALNIGYSPVAKRGAPALEPARLAHVAGAYLSAEAFSRANAPLIGRRRASHSPGRSAAAWSPRSTGCGSSSPCPSVYARPNRKYFGPKRGVTWLNMINDQAAGLGAKVIDTGLAMTSSKPPSSDSPYEKGKKEPRDRSLREKGGCAPGKQPGEPGTTMKLVDSPKYRYCYPPAECRGGTDLSGQEVFAQRRHQVTDIKPAPEPEVTEHVAQSKMCPCCGDVTEGPLPPGVRARASFGPETRAQAANLTCGNYVPSGRAAVLMAEMARARVIERYASPWSIEVAIQDSKKIFGTGQARNRTARAVERTVPFEIACQAAAVTRYATAGRVADDLNARRRNSPWYTSKAEPSTSDMTALLRRVLIATRFKAPRPGQPTCEELHAIRLAWEEAAA